MAAKSKALWQRHKWHLLTAHLGAAIAVLIVFLLGAFAGSHLKVIAGTSLDQKGQSAYKAITSTKVERGEREVLPASEADAIVAANQKAALAGTVGPNHPVPLATPEPSMVTSLVQNYSSRNGARPALLVVHDTESPGTPGSLQGALAIRAWFNNPVSQASSNYTTDCAGNTILMVPDTLKAWTQAGFNSWSISDELIGYASWTRADWLKCDTQLRAAAKLFAAEATKWGIPVRLGAVHNCTITRSGIVDHKMLGACGGGHHDNGLNFPMTYFIGLVHQYQHAGPVPTPKPKPVTTTAKTTTVVTTTPKPTPKPKPKPKPVPKPKPLACTVRNVQLELRAHGAKKLVVDGVLGANTRSAVSSFQKAHHLHVDGAVGPKTGAALGLGGCK